MKFNMPESESTSPSPLSPEQEEHYYQQAQAIKAAFERGDFAVLDDEVIDLGLELGLKGFDIERAKGILKEDCLGPDEVKQALGIEIDSNEIPPIPFSKAELERARELGQFLILRTDQDNDGKPLTMQRIEGIVNPSLEAQNQGKLLFDTSWYSRDPFYTQETSSLSWSLIFKEPVPDSTGQNYLEQTETLINYLKNQVFKDKPLPKACQEAIKEFEKKKPAIAKIISSTKEAKWKKEAKMLESLKITRLLRPTPVEALYDLAVYFKTNNQRLLPNGYIYTARLSSGGYLVLLGYFKSDGVDVSSYDPGYRATYLGAGFARSL